MTDIYDKASEIEQMQRELALKNRQKNTALSQPFCEDCEDKIPEIRLKAISGCIRCVTCQQITEQKAKGYRR